MPDFVLLRDLAFVPSLPLMFPVLFPPCGEERAELEVLPADPELRRIAARATSAAKEREAAEASSRSLAAPPQTLEAAPTRPPRAVRLSSDRTRPGHLDN
jgi:hypothetical protein